MRGALGLFRMSNTSTFLEYAFNVFVYVYVHAKVISESNTGMLRIMYTCVCVCVYAAIASVVHMIEIKPSLHIDPFTIHTYQYIHMRIHIHVYKKRRLHACLQTFMPSSAYVTDSSSHY